MIDVENGINVNEKLHSDDAFRLNLCNPDGDLIGTRQLHLSRCEVIHSHVYLFLQTIFSLSTVSVVRARTQLLSHTQTQTY